MKTMTKKAIREQMILDAANELRELLEINGHTVYTKLEHVSRSGMLRRISCFIKMDGGWEKDITSLVGLVTSYNEDKNKPGLRVSGCGMDMGFAVVYALSRKLYCTDGYNREGAYKINHRWM